MGKVPAYAVIPAKSLKMENEILKKATAKIIGSWNHFFWNHFFLQ
jgi:hypothetical protein